MANTITLELPWPPSINHYWRRGGNVIYISKEGRAYRDEVILLLKARHIQAMSGALSLKARLHPPNRMRRDLDNSLKVLIDSIAKGGAMGDDFQIKHIEATMLDVVKGGHVTVEISELANTEAA